MSRYDKYDPKSGGTRGALAADRAATTGMPVGVGFDAQGRMVVGAGTTGVVGVLCLTQAKKAGDAVDAMTAGDIVEFPGAAGTQYYAATDGVISTTNTGVKVGFTVEASRLVVRVK